MASASADDRAQPGDLMRLVADGLTASGLEVRLPEGEHRRRLTIGCPGARCALPVSDYGLVEWECRPQPGSDADPGQVADLATALLTGRTGDHPRRGDGYGKPGITLKGIVGLELEARGLDVELEVYEDKERFDARALIVVTNPAAGDAATVQVADDGCVTWSCYYGDEAAAMTAEPDSCGPVPGPAEVAAAVVVTVTTAMSQALPAGQVTPQSSSGAAWAGQS
jgi:hypothetical protein